VGWEKVTHWSTKAAVSLKRVKGEKSYYGGPIGSHQRSLQRYHSRPPTSSSSPRFGFATPTQNFNRYYLSNG